MTPRVYRFIRIVSAAALVVTALRHVMLAVQAEGSVLRHWLFVVVNVALAALLVKKHRWAFWPTIALTVQQLYSHGLSLADSFNGSVPLDWVSLVVCLFFPTLATILFIERQEEDEAAASEAS